MTEPDPWGTPPPRADTSSDVRRIARSARTLELRRTLGQVCLFWGVSAGLLAVQMLLDTPRSSARAVALAVLACCSIGLCHAGLEVLRSRKADRRRSRAAQTAAHPRQRPVAAEFREWALPEPVDDAVVLPGARQALLSFAAASHGVALFELATGEAPWGAPGRGVLLGLTDRGVVSLADGKDTVVVNALTGGTIGRLPAPVGRGAARGVVADMRPDLRQRLLVGSTFVRAVGPDGDTHFLVGKVTDQAPRAQAFYVDDDNVLVLAGGDPALRDARTGEVRTTLRVTTPGRRGPLPTSTCAALPAAEGDVVTAHVTDEPRWAGLRGLRPDLRRHVCRWSPGVDEPRVHLSAVQHDLAPCPLVATPDGQLVLWAEGSGVRLWDLARGGCDGMLPHRDLVTAVAVSDDARRAATVVDDAVLRIWDVARRETILVTAVPRVVDLRFDEASAALVVVGSASARRYPVPVPS